MQNSAEGRCTIPAPIPAPPSRGFNWLVHKWLVFRVCCRHLLPLNRQRVIKSSQNTCSRSSNVSVYLMEKVCVFIKIRVLFWPEISAYGVFLNFDNERMRPPLYLSAPPPPPWERALLAATNMHLKWTQRRIHLEIARWQSHIWEIFDWKLLLLLC